ncbi:uncharacterized protein LOC120339674 [Styela clava]|uniref:uncharacterized protein LOC120339674 isoform X2 n=1 Tax=Styela clava TaxID=7725 RepID=UPI00193A4B35|nr:uncharacterized protein LOC120339674 isoform X2 [Styela clava]
MAYHNELSSKVRSFSNSYTLETTVENTIDSQPMSSDYTLEPTNDNRQTEDYGTLFHHEAENIFHNTNAWKNRSTGSVTNSKATHDTLTKNHVLPPLPSSQYLRQQSSVPARSNDIIISKKQQYSIVGLFVIIALIACGGLGLSVYRGCFDIFPFLGAITIIAFFSIIVMISCALK